MTIQDSSAVPALRQPTVNPEIAKVLRKQTKTEREKLEALILRDGIQDPIVVWAETGDVLDGHNRLDIAAGNNSDGMILEYAIEEVSLADLDAAIEYVLERQEGRRNATQQDLSNARGKLYRRRKKAHGGDRKSGDAKSSAHSAHLKPEGKTSDEVAGESGVDPATIRRDAEYSIAIERLAEVFGKDFEAHVLSGESKLSKTDVLMLAGELGKDDALLYSASELWAFGKAGTFKLAHLLARIERECGPLTYAALWENADEDATVRESAPQLTHLLKLAGNDDEVTADLVEIVESGQPLNGKPIKSVQAAHKLRQKEREPEDELTDAEKAWNNFAAIMKRLHELAAGVDAAGGIHRILQRQPEQNQRIFVRDYRALAERALRQVEEFEQVKGGDLKQ